MKREIINTGGQKTYLVKLKHKGEEIIVWADSMDVDYHSGCLRLSTYKDKKPTHRTENVFYAYKGEWRTAGEIDEQQLRDLTIKKPDNYQITIKEQSHG